MWKWRSREDAKKLEIDTNRTIKNIALFLIIGSFGKIGICGTLCLLGWLITMLIYYYK